jgi:hypothetical protein
MDLIEDLFTLFVASHVLTVVQLVSFSGRVKLHHLVYYCSPFHFHRLQPPTDTQAFLSQASL